jgi:tetratricopeptide (TPR) repeat protein
MLSRRFAFLFPLLLTIAAAGAEPRPQAIFPGQAEPEVSAGILHAYDHALRREYKEAKSVCAELGRRFPQSPAGPVGEMVLYQVMMLENDDYQYDREFRDAALRSETAAEAFAGTAPKNDWYYTLLGAAWGIEGIYYLRQDEYLEGVLRGLKGLNHMQQAAKRNPENWEAQLGIGLYLYYRSAYSAFIPLPGLDQRRQGITMVAEAGRRRPYLHEVSWIALYYIYLNENDYDRARSYMDALIVERPDFPIFYLLAGRAMLAKPDYRAAAAYFESIRRLDPGLYISYFRLGECALHSGRKDEARSWFQRFERMPGARRSRFYGQAESYLSDLR